MAEIDEEKVEATIAEPSDYACWYKVCHLKGDNFDKHIATNLYPKNWDIGRLVSPAGSLEKVISKMLKLAKNPEKEEVPPIFHKIGPKPQAYATRDGVYLLVYSEEAKFAKLYQRGRTTIKPSRSELAKNQKKES